MKISKPLPLLFAMGLALGSCYLPQPSEGSADTALQMTISDVQSTNDAFMKEIVAFMSDLELPKDERLDYFVPLDVSLLNSTYQDSKALYVQFMKTGIDVQRFRQALAKNERLVIDSIFTPIGKDWQYYDSFREELQRISTVDTDRSGLAVEFTNEGLLPYWKTLIFYSRAMQLTERYIKELYLAPGAKFPFAGVTVRDGVRGLSIVRGIIEPESAEELIIRINGEEFTPVDGEVFIPNSELTEGDTLHLVVESHNLINGTIHQSEYDHVVEK